MEGLSCFQPHKSGWRRRDGSALSLFSVRRKPGDLDWAWGSSGPLQAACANWHACVAPGAATNGPLHFPVSFRATWENSRLLLWMLERAELSVCSLTGLPLIFLQNFKHHSTAFLSALLLLWESIFLVHPRIRLSGISQDKNTMPVRGGVSL